MTMSISRRGVILMAGMTGVGAWAAASKAAPADLQGYTYRRPAGAAGADDRQRYRRSQL